MVDMGNSSIKWATQTQKWLSPQQSKLYQNDSLDNILTQIWRTIDVPSGGVWISNVAGPQKAVDLTRWVKKHWGLEPTFLKTSRQTCGIKNGYDNPQQLGIDRWLALIGAHHLQKGMLCVVDCGTAITVDILSANGHHQGGLIIPGITAMNRALLTDTYALSAVTKSLVKSDEKHFLARNTHTGIEKGTLYTVIGLLKYVTNTLKKSGNSPALLLTGGGVPVLEPLLQSPYQYVPDLVLQGLKIIVNQPSL